MASIGGLPIDQLLSEIATEIRENTGAKMTAGQGFDGEEAPARRDELALEARRQRIARPGRRS